MYKPYISSPTSKKKKKKKKSETVCFVHVLCFRATSSEAYRIMTSVRASESLHESALAVWLLKLQGSHTHTHTHHTHTPHTDITHTHTHTHTFF